MGMGGPAGPMGNPYAMMGAPAWDPNAPGARFQTSGGYRPGGMPMPSMMPPPGPASPMVGRPNPQPSFQPRPTYTGVPMSRPTYMGGAGQAPATMIGGAGQMDAAYTGGNQQPGQTTIGGNQQPGQTTYRPGVSTGGPPPNPDRGNPYQLSGTSFDAGAYYGEGFNPRTGAWYPGWGPGGWDSFEAADAAQADRAAYEAEIAAGGNPALAGRAAYIAGLTVANPAPDFQ